MIFRQPGTRRFAIVTVAASLAVSTAAVMAQPGPDELLDRMNHVVEVIDYEGTVLRRSNGDSETLRIVRKVIDGVINEKLVSQEGNGLEIIRVGNEVHCILPDQQTVLIEEWANQSTLFPALPSSEIRYGAEYDVSILREDRIAGRQAIVLAVRPHDRFRYTHRIWLDEATAFPLKTEMASIDGEIIEEIKFAEISIGHGVSKESLAPSMSLGDFRWFTKSASDKSADVETTWQSTDLPSGFRAISTKTEILPGADAPVTHIVYSDGLATVSVFIARDHESTIAEKSRVGVSNTYTVRRGDYQITAVGEVPAATVERIATSMRQN